MQNSQNEFDAKTLYFKRKLWPFELQPAQVMGSQSVDKEEGKRGKDHKTGLHPIHRHPHTSFKPPGT